MSGSFVGTVCEKCVRQIVHHTVVVVMSVCLLVSTTSSKVYDDEVQCTPEQVHLAYGDTVSDVAVMWATVGNCSTSVVYGNTQWAFNDTKDGKVIKFDLHNEYGVQFLHRVILKDLKSSTTYHYRPLSNNIGRGPFYFKTPPSGQEWSPLFVVYGDLGLHSNSIPSLTEEVLTGEYDAVLHVGDFAYNLHDDFGQVGDRFMRRIQGISSQVPYMTSVGNHEIDDDTFAHYRHRFSMPHSDWPIPIDKMWYSIDIGPVHLISYSSEVFFTSDQQYVKSQHDWLLEDLKQANGNRDKRPWVVAMGHRPMYCSTSYEQDCNMPDSLVRQGFEDIFYHFGVDIVLQAHEHSYERLWPQYKGVVVTENYTNPAAPVQLITGAAGSKHGLDPMANATDNVWSAFRMSNGSLNSFGRLQIVNATHAFWEQKAAMDSELIDSIWIVQENHGPFKREHLPANVSKETEETRQATGEKLNIVESISETNKKAEIFAKDTSQRMAIGISFGTLIVVLVVGVFVARKVQNRQKTEQRWEDIDFTYEEKLYASSKDYNELGSDFEMDETLPTTKLLSND